MIDDDCRRERRGKDWSSAGKAAVVVVVDAVVVGGAVAGWPAWRRWSKFAL